MAEQPDELQAAVDFFECAPENWIGVGGRFGEKFDYYTENFPFVSHGLSLSLGGPKELDLQHLKQIKKFLQVFGIRMYTEHLSACSDYGQLYDLMPIPFSREAVRYVADRIKRVQDILEQRIAVEHISYYAALGQEMPEIEFIQSVLAEADCHLLLDVNNIYVNSVNFNYDPAEFLRALPADRIAYCHIAGHKIEADDLMVDTHATSVIEDVWDLLDLAYQHFGVIPTLLERDFNFPPLEQLLGELRRVRTYQEKYATKELVA